VIFGTTTFSFVHAMISLIGIGSGLIAMVGLLAGQRLDRWTGIFLSATIATSVTGFGFPFVRLLPSHVFAIISLIVLALAVYARYVRHMENGWRSTYVISAVVALYLNVFVLVVQLFAKLPSLTGLAPTQSEPPFLLAQSVVFGLFVALGVIAVLRFRLEAMRSAGPLRT
jgi:hypothetical protein